MENLFKTIFQSIQNDLQRNLEADNNQTLVDSSKPLTLKGSGTIPFNFHLDLQGNYHFETEKYGAGKTVNFCAWISDPQATYTITVGSSDGGGGHWENVQANQKECGVLDTSFWQKTKITVDLHANVTNVSGQGTIQYSY